MAVLGRRLVTRILQLSTHYFAMQHSFCRRSQVGLRMSSGLGTRSWNVGDPFSEPTKQSSLIPSFPESRCRPQAKSGQLVSISQRLFVHDIFRRRPPSKHHEHQPQTTTRRTERSEYQPQLIAAAVDLAARASASKAVPGFRIMCVSHKSPVPARALCHGSTSIDSETKYFEHQPQAARPRRGQTKHHEHQRQAARPRHCQCQQPDQ